MGTNGTFATSGNIVLSHEINNDTMNLALEFLPQIVSSYKQVQDVATCASITNPYFEDFVFTTTTNTTSNATTSSTGTATGSSSDAAGASTAVASVKPASFGNSLAPNLALAILLCATVLFN
jgi:hypothetical protein